MAITSVADELMIFPSADQSAEQKEQDKCACYSWVKGESGFDPMAPPTASEPSTPESRAKSGALVRGAARGAAVGQIVGGDYSSTATGAAVRVTIVGMRSQDQKRNEAEAHEQWEQEQVSIWAGNLNRFDHAYAASLERKDYTVANGPGE